MRDHGLVRSTLHEVGLGAEHCVDGLLLPLISSEAAPLMVFCICAENRTADYLHGDRVAWKPRISGSPSTWTRRYTVD